MMNEIDIPMPQTMTDKDLYRLCQEYGRNIKHWKRKFAALLSEVDRRRLYKKYGFYSIYEFAAKIGSLSKKSVKEILRTYQKVENKPLLRAEIEVEGWGKVRAISPLLENRDEKDLVYMVKNLSKSSIEIVARNFKLQKNSGQNILIPEETNVQSPPGWPVTDKTLSFKVDSETEFRLRNFQFKLEKKRKEKVPFNEVLKALLDEAENK